MVQFFKIQYTFVLDIIKLGYTVLVVEKCINIEFFNKIFTPYA